MRASVRETVGAGGHQSPRHRPWLSVFQQRPHSFDRTQSHFGRRSRGEDAIDQLFPQTRIRPGAPNFAKLSQPFANFRAPRVVREAQLLNCHRFWITRHGIHLTEKNSMGAIMNMSTKLRSVTTEVSNLTECISSSGQRHQSFVGRRKGSAERSGRTLPLRLMSMKRTVIQTTAAIASILLAAVHTFGQQAAPAGLSLPAAASESKTTAQPAYLTQIRGLQGVLAETLDGSTVAAQAVDEKFNPASSIKLATALAALKTYVPEHRFLTSLWASGKIDQATGTLNGDLIVAGRDPSFHYEHAVMLARELNELGIRAVSGNLIVSPGFTMNFDWSTNRSGEQLRDALDTTRRSTVAMQAWTDERKLVHDSDSLRTVPSVVVRGAVAVGAAPPEAAALLAHKSSRLMDILKVLLCYSNNFMAERIGDTVGGPQAVRTMLLDTLKMSPEE